MIRNNPLVIRVLRYLMVDVVVNNVMALNTTPDLSTFLFTEQVGAYDYPSVSVEAY